MTKLALKAKQKPSKKKIPGNRAKPVRELLKPVLAIMARLYENRGTLTGIPTGFRDLDRITSGLHAGNVIVIAARPSMGMTALAMNIVENVAIKSKLPVGVFSLQMSAEELVTRMLCSLAKVNLRSLHDGLTSDQIHQQLTASASKLKEATILIDDTGGLTLDQFRVRARCMKLQHDIQLLVVDYLQLMRVPSLYAEVSHQAELADISMGVKALAKELNIPVIVLSQLHRETERREGNRPELLDRRESGTIEQDADVVTLLVRPEMYAENPEERAAEKGKATLIIAKQRNGPTGEVALTFHSEYARFEGQEINDIQRCYRVLKLEPGASMDQVQQAWRERVNVWHPARFPGKEYLQRKGEERLKEINSAYETLEKHLAPNTTRSAES